MGEICTYILPYFTNKVYIPDFLITAMMKLTNDIKKMPAAHDLMTYLAS
jgi:hypothetical protein